MGIDVKDYKLIYDHHTHTVYTHGKGTILENVKVAHEKGLQEIAITEHGPKSLSYGLNLSDIDKMREEISEASMMYPDVKVLLGIELNLQSHFPYVDISMDDFSKFDIILCGYHYSALGAYNLDNAIWSKTRKELKYERYEDGSYQADMSMLLSKNTAMTINALDNNKIDILTHIGDKGPFDICDIAKKCEETGTLLEVNLKHKHLNREELKIAKEYDVKFVISSDAHDPSEVGIFEPQLKSIIDAGIDLSRVVNIRKK